MVAPRALEQLRDLAEQAEVLEEIRRGLDDMKAGQTQPVDIAFAEIRRELSLSLDS